MIAHRTFVSWKKLNSFPSWPTRSHSIFVGAIDDVGGGLVGKCGDDDFFYAADACGVGEQERINAATRDDSERFWRLHTKAISSAGSE
jgi:hypothetical protein